MRRSYSTQSTARKVEPISGGLEEVMDALSRRGYKRLYIYGGKTIQ